MTEHDLKVQQPYFPAILSGDKTFEVRRNDRGFQRGDTLRLREWDAGSPTRNARYTGNEVTMYVGFVYSGDSRFGGLEPGFVVLSLLKTRPRRSP